MPCYKPITAYRTKDGITFKKCDSTHLQPIKIPCNGCIGCRLDRSRSWAVRCMHEASLHEENMFITLTYSDEHLPENGTLVKKDFQKFMKRLRKYAYPKKIRFYMCGEYGEQTKRPHYHALIFGYRFKDCKLFRVSRKNKIYRSEALEKLWLKGFSEIGSVNYASAGYVARYVRKKITGDQAKSHYERVDKETGEISNLLPEYNQMSLRPGIGKDWYQKYGKTDCHQNDEIILKDGKRVRTPKYYDKLLEQDDPEALQNLKECREISARPYQKEQSEERLRAREKCAESRLKQLRREL